MSSAPLEEQKTRFRGEGRDTTVFGCGFNGFCQLSCAQGQEQGEGPVDVKVEQDESACQEKLLPECLFLISRKCVAQVQICWTTVIVLSNKGQVQAYGWIPGETGQPGYKDNLLPSYKIRDIKCVWNKILLLTHDGKALIWNNVTEEGSTPVSFPSIPSLQLEENQNADIRFKFISCSEKHCLVVTDCDKIWVVEEAKEVSLSPCAKPSEFISRPLLFDKNVQTVSCGKEHSLILTAEGKVYSFGNGSRGQLGHGITDAEHHPRLVEALDGIKLTQVHTGGWHSAVISEFGDLYTWGWNESGQIGVLEEVWGKSSDDTQQTNGHVQFQMVPALIDFPGENHVIQASCGSRHTAAVTNDGSLWTWGWGFYGQLGHGTRENCFTPTRVKFFVKNKLKVRSVTCGAWNTLMTVT